MNPPVSAFLGRQPRRMRRIARYLSVCLLVTGMFAGLLLSASPAEAVAGFGDVDDGLYYSEPVQWMVDNNIVTDTTGPCFSPHTPATRGETALYMWRMQNQPQAPPHPFNDVTDDDQHPAVSWMYDTEITTGTSPTTFGPDQQPTRAQLAALLHRLAGEPAASGHPFVDVVAGWQQQPVAWMVANKITTGTSPTTFAPNEPVSRGQLATFLYRYRDSPDVTIDPHSPPCEAFTAIDTASQHSCGIRTNGTIACWGNNEGGQAEPPNGSFKAVSAGGDHSCAIRTDNTLTCWGANWYRAMDTLNARYTAVTSGASHSCGLRNDATISCWGHNGQGQTNAPDGRFTAVNAGYDHSCGVRTDTTITCWGDNQRNQLDTPDGQFSAISAGNYHSCALRTDATITCWGQNSHGQTNAPAGQFSAISAGTWRSCGLRIDATITCWGNLWGGHPVAPDGQFRAVSAGFEHSCALRTDSTVTCWGRNWSAQTAVPDGRFNAISVGDDHACALETDNTVTCWGDDTNRKTHGPFSELSAISVGINHSCALQTDNTVTCWGYNDQGQTNTPTGQFSTIAAGIFHTCGTRIDNTVTCWGYNDQGQTNTPTGQFSTISAGGDHSCGVRIDNTITCWGYNGHGQTNTPDGQFSTITSGSHHSCASRTDNTITCWGNNASGQTNAPSGQFTAISAGRDHSCGIRANGSVICWGRYPDAQAGSFISVSAGTWQSCGIQADATISCWGVPIIPAPGDVQSLIEPGQADPTMCRPFGLPGITAGFPLPAETVRSMGTARVAVLFVDFPNAVAAYSTQIEAEFGMPYAETYLEASSYQKLDIEFVPLHGWLRAENDHEHYHARSSVGDFGIGPSITAEAVRLADPDFDFNRIDTVMVVLPSSHFSGGTASGPIETSEGFVSNSTQINIFPLEEPREPYRWGDVAAHELIHNLGLLDMYAYADLGTVDDPVDAPAGKTWVTSTFGRMGLRADFPADPEDPRLVQTWLHPDGAQTVSYATRSEAEEMLAWSRWQLGWLDAAQISCVTETGASVTLGPVADPGDNVAMAAIPLSGTEVIVIENRRKIGYDTPREKHYADGVIETSPALLTEGVLIYTVDAALPSGQLPLMIATDTGNLGDTGNLQVDRYPLLTDGESVTIGGYTITVQSGTDTTHTITITRNTD